jgi:hypothetical protein
MKTFFLIVYTAGLLLLASCHPEPDAKILIDDLAVATNYDPDANFNNYATYAIPTDTIGLISNSTNDTIIVHGESDFPRPILNAITSNLTSRGYTRVGRNQNPDLGINVLIVNDFNVFQEIVYPGGYPGNYYSGYYGYNSWYYYPYINTYAYNTGVLIVEIVDLKNRTPDNKVKVIWDAYMGDVYSTLDLVPQTVRAIDQSFTQSPYIGKSGN